VAVGCWHSDYEWAAQLRLNAPLIREEYEALKEAGEKSDYVMGDGEHKARLVAYRAEWLSLMSVSSRTVARWKLGVAQLRPEGRAPKAISRVCPLSRRRCLGCSCLTSSCRVLSHHITHTRHITRLCPTTAALLETVPNFMAQGVPFAFAFFSTMAGGTRTFSVRWWVIGR